MVRVWDVETGRKSLEMKGHREAVRAVTISADGGTLVDVCRVTVLHGF